MGKELHDLSHLKKFRRELRSNSTLPEILLWQSLQNKQLHSRKFRRQHSIGNYIVDFYCPSEKLIIELDGAAHFDIIGMPADLERDQYLQSLGMKVLRFENDLILHALEGVLEEI